VFVVVGVGVKVGVFVAVGVGVSVAVAVAVGVAVGVAVDVAVGVGVSVAVAVGVSVGVGVLVASGVGEPVGVGVGPGPAIPGRAPSSDRSKGSATPSARSSPAPSNKMARELSLHARRSRSANLWRSSCKPILIHT
jgi:hypothetical protein